MTIMSPIRIRKGFVNLSDLLVIEKANNEIEVDIIVPFIYYENNKINLLEPSRVNLKENELKITRLKDIDTYYPTFYPDVFVLVKGDEVYKGKPPFPVYFINIMFDFINFLFPGCENNFCKKCEEDFMREIGCYYFPLSPKVFPPDPPIIDNITINPYWRGRLLPLIEVIERYGETFLLIRTGIIFEDYFQYVELFRDRDSNKYVAIISEKDEKMGHKFRIEEVNEIKPKTIKNLRLTQNYLFINGEWEVIMDKEKIKIDGEFKFEAEVTSDNIKIKLQNKVIERKIKNNKFKLLNNTINILSILETEEEVLVW